MPKRRKRKYTCDPIPEKERNKKIYELRKSKNLSYRVLGRIFHISHTRVEQIIRKFEPVEK